MKRTEDAASPILGILVAAAIAISAIAVVVSVTTNSATDAKASNIVVKNAAFDALDAIISNTGQTSTGSVAWDASPDSMSRFGLASGFGPNFLDGEKVEALRYGLRTSSATNGKADYPEVRTALGLDGYDFHLRSFPVVYSLDDPRWHKYRGVSIAYIGESENGGVTPPSVTTTVTKTVNADHVLVKFKFACTGGAQPNAEDVLQVTTRLRTGNSNQYGTIVQNTYSPPINCQARPGSFVTVVVRFEKIAWKNAADYPELEYDVRSTYANEMMLTSVEYAGLEGTAPGSEAYTLTVEPESPSYHDAPTSNAPPVVILDKKKKDGARYVPTLPAKVVVDVRVTRPDGTSVTYEDLLVPASSSLRYTLTGLAGVADASTAFNVTVMSANGTNEAETYTHFRYTTTQVAVPVADFTDRADTDRYLLQKLVESFVNATYYDGAETGGHGDVYRDIEKDTRQTLADSGAGSRRLWTGRDGVEGNEDDYDLLVIGGGVKSAALSGQMADDIREWVEEGHTLLVLGVDEHNAQWLNSEFDIKIVTSSGGIAAPDETHSSLVSPDELSWRSYDSQGRRYEMTGTTFEGFTHVIVDTSGTNKDLLAISNPGVYGKGTVILASFIPHTLGVGDGENEKFLNNMLTQSLNTIIIDFGPAIPPGVSVGSTSRIVVVPHPAEPTLWIELRLVLYVWR